MISRNTGKNEEESKDWRKERNKLFRRKGKLKLLIETMKQIHFIGKWTELENNSNHGH